MNKVDIIFTKFNLSATSPTPLYRQLQQQMSEAISQGKLSDDDAIPPERNIAAHLSISRVTVRKAIQSLVKQGLLVQHQGVGTFVKARVEHSMTKLTGFTEEMAKRGMTPAVKWLDRSVGIANPEEAMALNISPDTEVSRLARIRYAGETPVAVEYTTVPRVFLPSPNVVTLSLYDVLTRSNHRPYRALQRLRAKLFSDEVGALLNLPPHSVTLYVERRSFLLNGKAVEFTRSYYHGDRYDFVAELQLDLKNDGYSN